MRAAGREDFSTGPAREGGRCIAAGVVDHPHREPGSAAAAHDGANGGRLVAGGDEDERGFFHAGVLDRPERLHVVEDGADVIIFGCTGMLGCAEAVRDGLLKDGLDVPVIDPVPTAVNVATALVGSHLSHSKRAYQPPPKRTPPSVPERAQPSQTTAAASATAKPKFTPQQIASRLRDLNRLYGTGYLTDEFYLEKVAECYVKQ